METTNCKAMLQGKMVTVFEIGTNRHLASFSVHARKSLRKRIAQWELTNNCRIENYTDGLLGKYRPAPVM